MARKDINKVYSAITPEDYEYLVNDYLGDKYLDGKLLKDLKPNESTNKIESRVKAISDIKNKIMKVVIVPKSSPYKKDDTGVYFNKYQDLYEQVFSFLDEYRLIGTPLYVDGAEFVEVNISANISVKDRFVPKNVNDNVEDAIKTFLHPFEGGTLKKGWPFGRGVFKSEIYKVMARVNGVDCVQKLEISCPNDEYIDDDSNLSIPDIGLIYLKEVSITNISKSQWS